MPYGLTVFRPQGLQRDRPPGAVPGVYHWVQPEVGAGYVKPGLAGAGDHDNLAAESAGTSSVPTSENVALDALSI